MADYYHVAKGFVIYGAIYLGLMWALSILINGPNYSVALFLTAILS